MFCVLYEFKVRAGREAEFLKFWIEVTAETIKDQGSLGARLHKADEGGFIAYAQWPDRKTWEAGHHKIETRSRQLHVDDLLLEIPVVLRHMESLEDLLVKS